MNLYPVRAIYMAELARTRRTLLQSIVSPVISTSLYFVVFGAAIGSRPPIPRISKVFSSPWHYGKNAIIA